MYYFAPKIIGHIRYHRIYGLHKMFSLIFRISNSHYWCENKKVVPLISRYINKYMYYCVVYSKFFTFILMLSSCIFFNEADRIWKFINDTILPKITFKVPTPLITLKFIHKVACFRTIIWTTCPHTSQ